MRLVGALAAGVLTAGVVTAGVRALPRASHTQAAPPSGEGAPAAPAAAQPCLGCHGPRGAGDPVASVPRIAGLSRYYSTRQLHSYANGTRQNAAMEAIVESLSPQEVDVVTAYFAQLDAPVRRGPVASDVAEQGRQLATTGSSELRVQACNNCHGPQGAGEPPAIPYLAGQGARYMAATLNAWRSGARRNDAGSQMAVIARALTPADIEAVAGYYAGLPAPPPESADVLRAPPRAPARVAVKPRAVDSIAPVVIASAVDIRQIAGVDLSDVDPARGQTILASGAHGCAGCHAIPGVRGANGVVGPPLNGIAGRGFIAGQLPNRPGVLVAFLLNPPALVPRTGMPVTGLTDAEAREIAAYLYTVER